MRGGEPHHLSLRREELEREVISIWRQGRDFVCDLLHDWRCSFAQQVLQRGELECEENDDKLARGGLLRGGLGGFSAPVLGGVFEPHCTRFFAFFSNGLTSWRLSFLKACNLFFKLSRQSPAHIAASVPANEFDIGRFLPVPLPPSLLRTADMPSIADERCRMLDRHHLRIVILPP
jgi:hypothetical protein